MRRFHSCESGLLSIQIALNNKAKPPLSVWRRE
jgi:hypothetical protein